MRVLRLLQWFLLVGFFPSCAVLDTGPKVPKETLAHQAFSGRDDYPKTMAVYSNDDLLSQATPENAKITVDLSEQRARLLVNQLVAFDTPCCTGKAGKRTPTGTFPIKEKIKDKRSNIFGSLYRGGRKVFGGDRRKYRGSYDRYVGSSLPYWMRLTDDGIGLHGSKYVHRYPRSNGCIRVPHSAISELYGAVQEGTPVQVVP